MEDTWGRLSDVFKDIFDDDRLEVSAATAAKDVDGWDSLAHVNLVMALEREFRVKFTYAEIQELKHVGDMVALINKKRA